MRKPVILGASLLATLAFAASARAGTTYYVSPSGTATADCTAREMPCDINSGATLAMAGDTVVLMDGTYTSGLYPANSGTADAWITFQADQCAVPIILGAGADPLATDQSSGVYSATSTYVRFVGLVVRGWSTGFGNGWTGTDTTTSNGHWEFQDCIADGNGRTGFTFFSAEGVHIQNCISAHNGSSIMESWSSGITLYEAQGGAGASIIEGNISFENMDNHDVAQAPNEAGKHSDGSGFIIDEYSNGATFVNNVAFGNGGSCLRLTKSSNAIFVNNTCYHNARDTRDAGPSNPSEVYFTDDPTRMNVSFSNNVFVATGSGPGAMTVYGKPTSGWTNNVEKTGSVSYFTGADGNDPDYTLASGATDLIGKGKAGTGVPTNDVGFDPKCIVKQTPAAIGMMTSGSWWSYSIDYDYIKSIGGVAKCFNPKMRGSTLDIGAYVNGAVTTTTEKCVPPVIMPTGSGGMGAGGMSSAGAPSSSMGGAGPVAGGANLGGMGASPGGAPGVGGSAMSGAGVSSVGTGGSSTLGGTTGGTTSSGAGSGTTGTTGGTTGTTGGTTSGSVGGSTSTGAQPGAGGASSGGSAGSAESSGSAGKNASGCGCRVAADASSSTSLAGLGLFALGLAGLKRRRERR
jgi:MYXO-CTERM domain-containing protein